MRLFLLCCCLFCFLGVAAAGHSAALTASPAEALSQAEEALNTRDATAATAWLRQALGHPRLAPGQRVEAELLLSRAARMQEQPEAALAAAERAEAVARAANDGGGLVAVLRQRSALAVLDGQTDVAAADLAAWESLAEEADEPQLLFEARVASARFLLDRGNADRALARLSLLARDARGVDLRSVYLAVAEVWLAKGDTARAVEAYSIVLRDTPEAAEALAGRAKARLQAGDSAAARKDTDAALAALPRMPSSLQRDLVAEALAALQAELPAEPQSAPQSAGAPAAESAIMRTRHFWAAPGRVA
jgi:hypothetical protein